MSLIQTSLIELMAQVRRAPSIYVGTPSLECLQAFMSGWFLSKGGDEESVKMWKDFDTYVQKKYGAVNESGLFFRVLQFNSWHTFDAFSRVFELFDEFLESRQTRRM